MEMVVRGRYRWRWEEKSKCISREGSNIDIQRSVLVFAWRPKTWTYSIELVDEFSRANESGRSARQYACEEEKKEYAVNAR